MVFLSIIWFFLSYFSAKRFLWDLRKAIDGKCKFFGRELDLLSFETTLTDSTVLPKLAFAFEIKKINNHHFWTYTHPIPQVPDLTNFQWSGKRDWNKEDIQQKRKDHISVTNLDIISQISVCKEGWDENQYLT